MLRDILRLLSKDNLQVQALSECYEMLDICRRMVRASTTSLRERDDASIDMDLVEADRRLNAFERDVRRKVMTHLAMGHTGDLASGLTLVSVVIDIERIGDYTKNIYDLARSHPARLHGGPLEEKVAAIEKHALTNFERSVETFKRGDLDEARRLMTGYKDDISRPAREIEEALVGGKVDMPASTATALALYMRFLKRISAHARNLVSSLVNSFERIGYSE